jgi:hypothetical protein
MTVLEVKKIFQPGLHFVGGTRGLILNVGQSCRAQEEI